MCALGPHNTLFLWVKMGKLCTGVLGDKYISPPISCIRRQEDGPVITGLMNNSMDRVEQVKGFIEYSPD